MEAVRLSALNARIGRLVNADSSLREVWVTAETSDLRVSGGHCYMELVDKDDDGRTVRARARAVIWASALPRVEARFLAVTGTRLRSDIKIMARVTVSYHAVYGLSLVISDINPEYTAGDLVRRRNEIIARLRAEGVFDLNRTLEPGPVLNRVAVVSAAGAAGYGDFIRHLYSNPRRLRFSTELFPAVLQGERTASSVIVALERIMERVDEFDGVVIIRGGGAVADLASFDDYDLAANVAQFPLPVIVGIGHERDITVLDYVAHTRVKTPTAAAAMLVAHQEAALDALRGTAAEIKNLAGSYINGQRQQLAYILGALPAMLRAVTDAHRRRLGTETALAISTAAGAQMRMQTQRLDSLAMLVDALSPQATMRRGFAIARSRGRALTSAATLSTGDAIEITLADGAIDATVTGLHIPEKNKN